MNELVSIGLILLLALLAGHLVKVLRVPEVTGYILAGVALGPSLLGWLSQDNLATLGVLSEVALGLILFSVGSVFEFSLFHRIGRNVLLITLVESSFAAVAVTGGALWFGQAWPEALLLGAIATATAPASTLMVIRECDSAGPLTNNLLGIIAVNNLLCITMYGLVAALIDITVGLEGLSVFDTIYRSAYWFLWQLIGSAALGYLVGLLLAGWASHVTEGGEMLILLAGSILLCVGASRALNLSPLITSLAVGATMVNLTHRSRHLFETLSKTDPPFYAMFFVIAGAELDVSRIPAMGMLGLVYVLGRSGGKFAGAGLATWKLGLEPAVRTFLGFALQAQAGLAVGLTLAVNARYPQFAPVVSTVVLASVAVFEMVGPTSTRFALVRAGEAGLANRPHPDVVTVDL
ncbi:MAG TPA: cation:proton antiporter [Vicinamibacterales bacterium]|nr:cation:proton antiporter [Vicinamibacterales bacterium]